MSLGWQGESALLPKKAKPISVDGKSMARLKAALMDEEQKMTYRNQKGLRALRGAKSIERNDAFNSRNRGVEVRGEKDKLTKSQSEDVVTATLIAKTRIYDALPEGTELGGDHEAYVIQQVEQKIRVEELPETSVIEDEFGRIKRVRTTEISERSSSSPPQGSSSWAWSQGRAEVRTKYEQGIRTTKLLTSLIEETVAKQVSDLPSSSIISSDSRVKSQWEKTLHGESRNYLDQIHRETIEKRSATKIQEYQDASLGVDSRTALNDRRELLKRKKEEKAAGNREV